MNNKTMKDETEKSIPLDSIEFKKISKSLQENIQREIKLSLLKKYKDENLNSVHITFDLPQVHNLLAKSLGFKSYKAVDTYFNENKVSYEAFKKGRMLDNLEANDMIFLFTCLIPENNILKPNAIILISTVVKALVHMRNQQEILLNGETIIEYLKIESLWKLYKTRRDFSNAIRTEMYNYFSIIPEFNINSPITNMSTIDNKYHSQIAILLYPIIKLIDNVEVCDPIIISPKWYQENYIIDNNKDELPIKINNFIDESKLNKFYNKFTNNDWKELFENKVPIVYENEKKQKMKFHGFTPINSIVDSHYFENSWLADEQFQEVLNNLIKNKEFKTYYLSDLLFYTMKIVNKEKKELYKEVLMNLLNHHYIIVEYSAIFNNLAKPHKTKK